MEVTKVFCWLKALFKPQPNVSEFIAYLMEQRDLSRQASEFERDFFPPPKQRVNRSGGTHA